MTKLLIGIVVAYGLFGAIARYRDAHTLSEHRAFMQANEPYRKAAAHQKYRDCMAADSPVPDADLQVHCAVQAGSL
jgi:hypothetical protein